MSGHEDAKFYLLGGSASRPKTVENYVAPQNLRNRVVYSYEYPNGVFIDCSGKIQENSSSYVGADDSDLDNDEEIESEEDDDESDFEDNNYSPENSGSSDHTSSDSESSRDSGTPDAKRQRLIADLTEDNATHDKIDLAMDVRRSKVSVSNKYTELISDAEEHWDSLADDMEAHGISMESSVEIEDGVTEYLITFYLDEETVIGTVHIDQETSLYAFEGLKQTFKTFKQLCKVVCPKLIQHVENLA